jgi:hypothetical protein
MGCANEATIREDLILKDIIAALGRVLGDAEDVITMATERAMALTKSNREDSQRIRIRIREIDGEVAKLIRLIGDQAIADMAKKSISRELATFEQDRQRLQGELERLADEANDNTEEIAREVRTVMAELKQGLVAPNAKELRGIIEEFVGPILLLADGTVAQANASADFTEAHATGVIAGVGFEPTTSGL